MADVVAMHQHHGHHHLDWMSLEHLPSASAPILSWALAVRCRLDFHELAEVAVPVEEEVSVHLVRREFELHLVCGR